MIDDWKADLQPLFKPRSIALIGASEASSRARALFNNLRDCRYSGELFPVNPSRHEFFGLKCYPTVTDIPAQLDAFVMAIPRDRVLAALEECAAKNIRAGVIVSAGFAEASQDGQALQTQLRKVAEAAKIRVCGPNCFGVANLHDRVALLLGTDIRHVLPGNMGLVFQSGGLLNLMLLAAWDRGWGVSHAISCGNEAVIHVAHYAEYLLCDDRTRVIGILVEGIKDPKRFIAVARLAAERGKPLIVLKMGKSAKGATAAQAHTASLVGSDAAFDAICRQYGIVRVHDLDEFIETMELFSKRKTLRRGRLGFIAPSGAECGLIADLAADVGIEIPEFSAATITRIRAVQSPFLTIHNPMNAPEQYSRKAEVFNSCMDALLSDDNVDVLGLRLPLPRLREDKDVVDRFRDIAQAAAKSDKLIIIFSRASVSLPEYWRQLLREHQIPFLLEYRKGFTALRSLIDYQRFLESARITNSQTRLDIDVAKLKTMLSSCGPVLTERQSKEVLAQYGIPVTTEILATNAEEAVTAANEVGYPVVLKIESPEILHKTEARGVEIGIENENAVRAGFGRIVESTKTYNPKATINGVLVQEMIVGSREVIIGMTQDAQWGPTIAFGLGGLWVEVLNDISTRVPPLRKSDAEEMLGELKGSKFLHRFRAQAAADTAAIIDVLMRFSQLCLDLKDEIQEIDINPLMVFEQGKGVQVADCLMVRRATATFDKIKE